MLKGLKSLVAGVVAGTALGVLFAPKEGKKFRDDVKKEIEKGGTGIGAVKETLSEMGKEMGKEIGEISRHERVQDIKKKATKKAKSGIKTAKQKASKAVKDAKKSIKKKTK